MRTGNDTAVDRLVAVGILAAAIGLACRGAAAFPGSPPITLFNTGPERLVLFTSYDDCELLMTFLAWSSGRLCVPDCANDTFPQRRTAQPFDLLPAAEGANAWRITEIGVDGFAEEWWVTETLDFEIFTRTDLGTPPGPADSVASGSVPFPIAIENPAGGSPGEHLHIMPVDITLSPGDYWLTVWGSNSDPRSPPNFAWFTNADHGINVLDAGGDAHMWRAATYPDPGFEFYWLDECRLQPYEGSDPDDLYNASFYIRGKPACPWDLDHSGSVGVVDFLDLLASWGSHPGHPADFDGDGAVGVTDFLDMLSHWGPCP